MSVIVFEYMATISERSAVIPMSQDSALKAKTSIRLNEWIIEEEPDDCHGLGVLINEAQNNGTFGGFHLRQKTFRPNRIAAP